jgi:AhpD family alkylhydroperoxidase
MSRIAPVPEDTATPEEAEALAAIRSAWGSVPQLGRVIARSGPLTRAMLAFDRELAGGRFRGAFAEQLDIAVANENRCPYCLAAHTAAGRAFGLDDVALADARVGRAADPKQAAALGFVQAVVRDRGKVDDRDMAAVRTAGWSDGDIAELVGHAISAMLTNYLHHLSGVPVDFPHVEFAPTRRAAEAA